MILYLMESNLETQLKMGEERVLVTRELHRSEERRVAHEFANS